MVCRGKAHGTKPVPWLLRCHYGGSGVATVSAFLTVGSSEAARLEGLPWKSPRHRTGAVATSMPLRREGGSHGQCFSDRGFFRGSTIGWSAGEKPTAQNRCRGYPRCPEEPTVRSVPQGLAFFQHVLHALHRLLLPAQAHKGLALEVEQVLLGDALGRRELAAAREHPRQRGRDRHVVVRDVLGAAHEVESQLHFGEGGLAQN